MVVGWSYNGILYRTVIDSYFKQSKWIVEQYV